MACKVDSQIYNSPTSFKGESPKLFTIESQKWKARMHSIGNLSTPANRLLMGASALLSQPFFDYYNKEVDEDTRKVSCARTIAKIVVGSLTGIYVRMGCIKLMEKYTRTDADFTKAKKKGVEFKPSEWDRLLAPNDISKAKFETATRMLKKHRQALGSIMALGVMLFTNFLIDAPCTTILANTLSKYIFKPKSMASNTNEKGGN